MKCWPRDAGAQQHEAHNQPWFHKCLFSKPGKHTTPTQVGPPREKPREFTEMIVKDPIILQLG